jgi:hypothetical protein
MKRRAVSISMVNMMAYYKDVQRNLEVTPKPKSELRLLIYISSRPISPFSAFYPLGSMITFLTFGS